MARQYYVPVERKTLPAADRLRWMILPVEAPNPQAAFEQASTQARAMLGLKRNFTVWAAVADIPSFEYLAELRDSYDNAFGRVRRAHMAQTRIAGYA